eukprot:4535594-Pyramimonas_sp.AAC.1
MGRQLPPLQLSRLRQMVIETTVLEPVQPSATILMHLPGMSEITFAQASAALGLDVSLFLPELSNVACFQR